jgi:hypothetical protein
MEKVECLEVRIWPQSGVATVCPTKLNDFIPVHPRDVQQISVDLHHAQLEM